jgi:hypothetical protein
MGIFDPIRELVEGTADIVNGASGGGNDIDDTLGDDPDPSGDPVDAGDGAKEVFDIASDGIEAIQGFLRWLGGIGDTLEGVGSFVTDRGNIIPVAGDQVRFAGEILNGVGGAVENFMYALAGGVAFLGAYFDFVTGMEPWQAVAYLLGSLMIVVGGYLLISGILTLEVLVVPSYVNDLRVAGTILWVGGVMLTYAAAETIGMWTMWGTGAVLMYVAASADEGQFLTGAYATLAIGTAMIVAQTLAPGLLFVILFAAATPIVVYQVFQYATGGLAQRVTDDEALLPVP